MPWRAPEVIRRDEEPGAGQPLRRQKIRDRAMVLPLLGLVMLLPPVARIFEIDGRVFGVPFTAVYLFTVWAMLILGAALLARALRVDLEAAYEPTEGDSRSADHAPAD